MTQEWEHEREQILLQQYEVEPAQYNPQYNPMHAATQSLVNMAQPPHSTQQQRSPQRQRSESQGLPKGFTTGRNRVDNYFDADEVDGEIVEPTYRKKDRDPLTVQKKSEQHAARLATADLNQFTVPEVSENASMSQPIAPSHKPVINLFPPIPRSYPSISANLSTITASYQQQTSLMPSPLPRTSTTPESHLLSFPPYAPPTHTDQTTTSPRNKTDKGDDASVQGDRKTVAVGLPVEILEGNESQVEDQKTQDQPQGEGKTGGEETEGKGPDEEVPDEEKPEETPEEPHEPNVNEKTSDWEDKGPGGGAAQTTGEDGIGATEVGTEEPGAMEEDADLKVDGLGETDGPGTDTVPEVVPETPTHENSPTQDTASNDGEPRVGEGKRPQSAAVLAAKAKRERQKHLKSVRAQNLPKGSACTLLSDGESEEQLAPPPLPPHSFSDMNGPESPPSPEFLNLEKEVYGNGGILDQEARDPFFKLPGMAFKYFEDDV
jgi:hypothetical protein